MQRRTAGTSRAVLTRRALLKEKAVLAADLQDVRDERAVAAVRSAMREVRRRLTFVPRSSVRSAR